MDIIIKFYLKTDNNGTVLDAITYPHEGYTLHEADVLPVGVNGGWKLENDKLVEYPELKPKTESEEIANLKQSQAEQDELLMSLMIGGV